jgi:hypothetical protein
VQRRAQLIKDVRESYYYIITIISLPSKRTKKNVDTKRVQPQLLTWTGASPKIADIGAIGRANKKRTFGLGQCQLSFESFGTITLDTTIRIYRNVWYPLKECSYINNLELFRRYEAQLRLYFAYLIGVFKELQNDADVATLRA